MTEETLPEDHAVLRTAPAGWAGRAQRVLRRGEVSAARRRAWWRRGSGASRGGERAAAHDAEVRVDLGLLESLHDGRGVGEAGRLEEEHVELVELLLEALQRAHQVAAHRATRAAVVHRDDLLRHLHVLGDEARVDVDAAKLVLDHCPRARHARTALRAFGAHGVPKRHPALATALSARPRPPPPRRPQLD